MAPASATERAAAATEAGMRPRCPLCGGVSSGDGRRLDGPTWRCRDAACGLEFASPQIDDQSLSAAYRRLYYPENGSATLENTAEYQYRQFFDCVDAAFGSFRGKRLLDYGCGAGNLLRVAGERGIEASGIEFDPVARELLQKGGRNAVYADLDSLRAADAAARFDCVVMWNVVEHLRAPWRDIAELAALIERGGVLFAITPNGASLKGRLLGARWDQRRNPTHFYLFTPASLRATLERAGLSQPATVPLHASYEHHGGLRRMVQRGLAAAGLQGELVMAGRTGQ